MTNQDILRRIDHTLLKPTATWDDVKALCDEAVRYGTASACIPPCYVAPAKSEFGNELNVCTVIGFPLGYGTRNVKIAETEQALEEGASEIDMVINICRVKNRQFDETRGEIESLKKTVGNRILKVIVETCYLTREEKIALCEIVTAAGADFIKTSTGFGTAGAALEDIALFKEHIGKDVKIKASGGIRTRSAIEAFIEAGAARIGTSSGVELLK
jgi:deoxyribose-phosphate aldolase